MARKLRDLPNNGKFITIDNKSELKPLNPVAQTSLAKSNQVHPIINTNTGELLTAMDGKVRPVSGVVIYSYTFDVATLGGATGSTELDGPRLEASLDVIDGYYDVVTAAVGVGASFSLGTSSSATTNLKSSAVIATNGTTGRKQLTPDYYANGITNVIDVSAAAKPVINITGAALTVLKFELVLFCVPRQY